MINFGFVPQKFGEHIPQIIRIETHMGNNGLSLIRVCGILLSCIWSLAVSRMKKETEIETETTDRDTH